jgi:hypothetical protein
MSWTHIIKTNQCFVFRSMLIKRPRTCIAAIHCNPPECHLIEPRSTIPNMCGNLRTYANSKIHVLYHDCFFRICTSHFNPLIFLLYKKWWITCISFLTHLHHFQLRNVGSFSSLHMIQSNTSEPKKITQPNPRPKKNQRCFCKNMMTCNTANTAKTWLCIFVATIANGKFHQGSSQTMLSHGLCCHQKNGSNLYSPAILWWQIN